MIDAAGAIGSDHDASKALAAIADRMPATADLAARYRAAASRIGSEHDRRRALAALD